MYMYMYMHNHQLYCLDRQTHSLLEQSGILLASYPGFPQRVFAESLDTRIESCNIRRNCHFAIAHTSSAHVSAAIHSPFFFTVNQPVAPRMTPFWPCDNLRFAAYSYTRHTDMPRVGSSFYF